MKTFKRIPNNVDTSLGDYKKLIKYSNQMSWKGIVENRNIFDVDQKSLSDAKNVYVDDHGTLSSRDPLQIVKLPEEILPTNTETTKYSLLDIKEYDNVKIYVVEVKQENKRKCIITAEVGEQLRSFTITPKMSEPMITAIENYIICFNDDTGAKVFDVNEPTMWHNFTNFAEVPITERTVGSTTTTYAKNQFTSKYVKEYIWSNISHPTLPKSAKLTIKVDADSKALTWNIEKAGSDSFGYDLNEYTQYLALREMNIIVESTDSVSVSGKVVCVAKADRVFVSRDSGSTFDVIYYPTTEYGYLGISSVCDTGDYFFYVHENGVYRLALGDNTWVLITPHNKAGKNIKGGLTSLKNYKVSLCHFVAGDIFTFILDTNIGPILWFMAPGLVGYDGLSKIPTKSTLIPAQYIGTLGCSPVFLKNETSLLRHINSQSRANVYETWNTYLKIIKDNGNYWKNLNYVNDSSWAAGGEHVAKEFYTIALNMINYYGSTQCMETYILPGSNCPTYLYNNNEYSEPLDLTPSFFNTSGLHSYVGKSNSSSGIQSVSLPSRYSDQSTAWLSEYPPKAFRIDKVEAVDSWSVGEQAGTIRQSYNTKYPSTIYRISGSMYFDNVPRLNTEEDLQIVYDTHYWHKFTFEVGYHTLGSSGLNEGAYCMLVKTQPSYTIQFTPILLKADDYYMTSQIYTNPLKPLTRMYTNRISMPTELIELYNNMYYSHIKYLVSNNNGNLYILLEGGRLYTNVLNDGDTARFQVLYSPDNDIYTRVPNTIYSSSELYLSFDNKLSITANTRSQGGNLLFNLSSVNDQNFAKPITNIINISTTDIAIFFEDQIVICSKVEDDALGYRYDYYPTKLSTGTRLGDDIVNTIEGTYTIFPTKRGLAIMNYQAFIATTDQVLTYISDNIEDKYTSFYNASNGIKILQFRNKLFLTNGTGDILICDINLSTWWYWEVPVNVNKMTTDQVDLCVISNKLLEFKEHKQYYDFPNTSEASHISWYLVSQPLHLNYPNYYKNLKQLVFQFLDTQNNDNQHSITAQVQCYRKRLNIKEPELITFNIEDLRTFVKRFNYWKVNEVQYALSNDSDTAMPTQLKLNGIGIKYELGEEVR